MGHTDVKASLEVMKQLLGDMGNLGKSLRELRASLSFTSQKFIHHRSASIIHIAEVHPSCLSITSSVLCRDM